MYPVNIQLNLFRNWERKINREAVQVSDRVVLPYAGNVWYDLCCGDCLLTKASARSTVVSPLLLTGWPEKRGIFKNVQPLVAMDAAYTQARRLTPEWYTKRQTKTRMEGTNAVKKSVHVTNLRRKVCPKRQRRKAIINMCTPFENRFPALFRKKWDATGLAESIAKVDRESLCHEFTELIKSAPRRPDRGKKYFVGHSGVPSSGMNTNRREEHYAIALCNLKQKWARLGGGWFCLLDYQVPLKARQNDRGIGEIDLVGVTDQGRLIVIELKVEASGNGRGDAPPTALMEGLRYSAIVQANLDAIAKEADARFGVKITQELPIVLLLAPLKWWRDWLGLSGRTRSVVGDWETEFAQLIQDVELKIGVTVECMALEDVNLTLGQNGQAPKFVRVPTLDSKDVIHHYAPSH